VCAFGGAGASKGAMKFKSGAFALLAPLALCASTVSAMADGCGYCHKPIIGTPYVLKNAAHSEKFKCAYCAVADASSADDWKGNVTMIAPSENPKKPVTLKRVGGKWKAFPATAAFTEAKPIKHQICGSQYRAFTSAKAAQAYVKTGRADKVISLAQLVKIAG